MNIYEIFLNQNEFIEFGDKEPSNVVTLLGSHDFSKKIKFEKNKSILVFENNIPTDLDVSKYEVIDLNLYKNHDFLKYLLPTREGADTLVFKILSVLSKSEAAKSKNSITAYLNIFIKNNSEIKIESLIDFFNQDSTVIAHKSSIIKKITKFLKSHKTEKPLNNHVLFFNFTKAKKHIKYHILDILDNEKDHFIKIENSLGEIVNQDYVLNDKIRDVFVKRHNHIRSSKAIINHITTSKDGTIAENILKTWFSSVVIAENESILSNFNKKDDSEIISNSKINIDSLFVNKKNDLYEISTLEHIAINFIIQKKWDSFLHFCLIQLGYSNLLNLNNLSILVNSENNLNYSVFSGTKDGKKILFYLTDEENINPTEEEKNLIHQYKNESVYDEVIYISEASQYSTSKIFSDMIKAKVENKTNIIYSFFKEQNSSPILISTKLSVISCKKGLL